jgi:hypothetical protein
MFDPSPRGSRTIAALIVLGVSGWATAGSPNISVVLDNLPATLFSISGAPHAGGSSGPGLSFDIFSVGASSPDGHGPLLLRSDGASWQRLATGQHGDLWWISDRPVDGSLFLSGTDGMILRLDPATLLMEREKAPGGITLFGIWGTGADNLWAVGGDISNNSKGGVVLKRSGTEWVPDSRVADTLPGGYPSIYKIWGRSATEIYAVGLQGTALFFDGTHWSVIPTGSTEPLFTVSGDATLTAATGGSFQGVIMELAGGAFSNHAPPGAQQINGISVRDGAAVAVGLDGALYRRGDSAWVAGAPAHGAQPLDLHGAWIDPDGGVWAVGGDLTIDRSYGAVAYAGSAQIGHDLLTGIPCSPAGSGAGATISYARDVFPLLNRTGCLNSGCHGASQPTSSYDLTSYKSLFGSGNQAFNLRTCDITPGDPSASYLIEKLGPSPRVGARMPTNLPTLTDPEVLVLSTWILEGALMDAAPATPFSRGDVSESGAIDISDPIAIINFLFLGLVDKLTCREAADVNNDGGVDVSDPVALLNWLFQAGPPPAAPGPPEMGPCGFDPDAPGSAGDLGCETYGQCH